MMMQHLKYDHKDNPINTGVHGVITHYEWLEYEQARILAKPNRQAEIRSRINNKLKGEPVEEHALYVNQVAFRVRG